MYNVFFASYFLLLSLVSLYYFIGNFLFIPESTFILGEIKTTCAKKQKGKKQKQEIENKEHIVD